MGVTPTLRDLFVYAARKLRTDYEEACVEPHPAQRGEEREDLLATFLAARLPRRLGLAKGHCIDLRDQCSPQLDLMVYDALQTVVYRPSSGGTFIPYDSLLGWVEVKSRLTRAGLRDAFQAAAATKALQRAALKVGDAVYGPRSAPPSFLFAFSSDLSMDAILDGYLEEFFTQPVGCHLDCVFVLDQSEVSISVVRPGNPSHEPSFAHLFLGQPLAQGKSLVFFSKPGSARFSKGVQFDVPSPSMIRLEAWRTGELTLWAFLRLLSVVLQPSPVFGAWVPWNADEPMDWAFQNLAVCIDATTPPDRYQSEIDRVFQECGAATIEGGTHEAQSDAS